MYDSHDRVSPHLGCTQQALLIENAEISEIVMQTVIFIKWKNANMAFYKMY